MPLWRKRHRFHGLKRPKIRQDMKKENLYNISRLTKQHVTSRTFFQQKWTAKAMTRAYHGEQIRESQWTRMFDRSTNAVVPMSPNYLAAHDGSDQAAGRGSGLQFPPEARQRKIPRTPYMQMVYHPTERRLDTAIFRALFASSARQARQHVTHGHVKVNGKAIRHPGYMLNPGDLFQVDPERVMFAVGAPKGAGQEVSSKNTVESELLDSLSEASGESIAPAGASPDVDSDLSEELSALEDADADAEGQDEGSDAAKQGRQQLKLLQSETRRLLENPKKLSNKVKQDLRAFSKDIRASMSKAGDLSPSDMDDLSLRLESLALKAEPKPGDSVKGATDQESGQDEEAEIQAAVKEINANPVDASKPYATPWRPRDYMSAFAFIPRYLEVNQKICSAVYLRHPVCYPGFAEVPTPFHPETGQLAFNWYLKRR